MDAEALLDLWTDWQRAQALSARTIDERTLTMRAMASGGADLLDLTPIDIVRFTARTHLSKSSKATYHSTIRAYCAWLVRVGLRSDDPSASTPRPKRPKMQPRPVHDAQLERVLERVNRRRTRSYVLLGALAGLRVHEIAAFDGTWLNLDAGTVTIPGKGGRVDVLPVHEAVLEDAAAYPSSGYWFPAYEAQSLGEHIRPTGVGQTLSRAMRAAGVPATAHQLRHWYATSLLEKGVDVRVVQTLLRHQNLGTTEIYTRVDARRQREAIAALTLPRRAA